ncbi:MAG: polyprenyl synthetase family protein [Candidatus Njordarchaeia archaeon]
MGRTEEFLKKIKEKAKIVDKFILENLDQLHKDLYEASLHLFKAGGKRARPYLALTSYQIFRDDIEKMIPFASSLEVLHTFTLIHDDIMDNDDLRRGQPTVHKVWGVPMAILAGDYLFAKVFHLVSNADAEPSVIAEAVREISEMMIKLCDGQAYDLTFEKLEKVPIEDYYSMISKKTAALIRTAARLGGIVAKADRKYVDLLGEFGEKIGIAFQMVDDIIGLIGEEGVTGKPKGSDIREGKKTLPILYALGKLEGEELEFLKEMLDLEKNKTKEDIEKAISLIEKTGAIEYVRNKAKELYKEAIGALKQLPDSKAKEELLDFAYVMVERNF